MSTATFGRTLGKRLEARTTCVHVKCLGAERDIVSQFRAGLSKISVLSCGHSKSEKAIGVTPAKSLQAYTWNGGKKLFDPFQVTTINKTETSDINFQNLNEMGLGKMVTSVATLHFHPEILPAIVVCKSRLTQQWFEHIVRMSEEVVDGKRRPRLLPQILQGGNAWPFPDIFNVCIVSFDTLWRIVLKSIQANKEKAKELVATLDAAEDNLGEELLRLAMTGPFSQYKTIIVDEFQMIKNPAAKRTKAVRIIGKNAKHKMGLSGTPTKNNAEEWYVFLNLLAPHLFPSFKEFCEEWVEYFTTTTGVSKALGIKPNKRAEFDKLIEPFTVRYTRAEVMPDLPPILRQYEYIELADKVKEAYKKELKGFEDAYTNWEAINSAKEKAAAWGLVYDHMMKLKRIVGLAKADWLVQEDGWLEEFLGQSEDKIVIAHHHVEAGLILATASQGLCNQLGVPEFIHLHGGLSVPRMYDEIARFTNDPKIRGIIIRQLAEGEGTNLQIAGHLVQLERQWNPANEEQVEARLPRPGTKYAKVNVLYPVALGTIDEFLAQTVERKRYAAENTYGKGAQVHWVQGAMLQEVAKLLFDKGMRPWGK